MTYLFLFFVLPILTSCQNAPVGPMPSTATITIHNPAEGAEFNKGDTVHISASIKADFTLHGYDIYLRNASSGEQLFYRHLHVHGRELSISQPWVHNQKWAAGMTGPLEVELEIAVLVDHGGTRESQKLKFVCLP